MIESWQELVRIFPKTMQENNKCHELRPEEQYVQETHEALISKGTWTDNETCKDYHEERVYRDSKHDSSHPSGWFGSYYIGPTDDLVLDAMPTPVHAADYIAQQHDLEYKQLGLNGISGTLQPESKGADQRLIQRCDELITAYEKGIKEYHGFAITKEAYIAARYMREYFIVEETLSDFFHMP